MYGYMVSITKQYDAHRVAIIAPKDIDLNLFQGYESGWRVGAPEMAKKVSLKGATESGQRPSDRLSYFGRKRKEENSMTEKRKYLVPIKGDVPQGQHCIWLKLHCLNPRLLALTITGAPLSGKMGYAHRGSYWVIFQPCHPRS